MRKGYASKDVAFVVCQKTDVTQEPPPPGQAVHIFHLTAHSGHKMYPFASEIFLHQTGDAQIQVVKKGAIQHIEDIMRVFDAVHTICHAIL